jgi:hypothetical protein
MSLNRKYWRQCSKLQALKKTDVVVPVAENMMVVHVTDFYMTCAYFGFSPAPHSECFFPGPATRILYTSERGLARGGRVVWSPRAAESKRRQMKYFKWGENFIFCA